MELDIRQYITTAKERQDCGALQSAFSLIKEMTGTNRHAPRFSPEAYVLCAEAALQLGHLEISKACLKMYFEANPPANQFLGRAYLCQGQLKSPLATGSVEDFEEAVLYFLKAIEVSKHEPRYHFLVFNASVLYFQTVRPLLQPGRCLHLIPSLTQVVQSLEEVADQDHMWRAELMMQLIKCLVDSGKMEEAGSFAKVTEEFIKSHTPHLYPQLFTLLVQHKLSESDVLFEMSQQSSTLAAIYKIQQFKIWLEEIKDGELDREDSAKLKEIFDLLLDNNKESAEPLNSSPPQSPAPIPPVARVAFLLELALLALQVKHQKVAADCLKELKTMGEASIGQRILMECINCEISLLKKDSKMNDYSKSGVEARMKEIGKLDQWLQTAMREGDPEAMQAVCTTQWSFCLPLLQHNLRKHVKTALLRVAQALEDVQSTLLELRCQVHSELALIEEEEGRLEVSLTHLQRAMQLDNGTQQERLSLAFRLLQLRGTLYQTPSRAEDKAAMLMQQARDMQLQDKADSRPMLVAVGLLLAPDDFQMVLDADNPSQIPVGSVGTGPVAQLSAKAQHHSACVQKVDRHLASQGESNNQTERVKLWAALVKAARKQEVWDVCRAACRFCLLYDDGRWKDSKTNNGNCSKEESSAEERLNKCIVTHSCEKDLLRLLAEICFINAEATVQKLHAEGVQLNEHPVPPVEKGAFVSPDDPHWIIYRDWIQALSAYATSGFLRAAELGAEINEPWVITNAAIYLWNYNKHLLAAREYPHLLPTFQVLVEMLRKTEYTGNHTLFVLLCNAVALGLIQPLYEPNIAEPVSSTDKGKNTAEKGVEKIASVQGVFLDPAALQDVRKALELCEYALQMSSSDSAGEAVPIAARKRVVSTWVQVKRLLQQQIGPTMDADDECKNEEVSAMMRVLIGLEMFQCNRNPKHMEFSLPALSTLVSMASECSWNDAVVEMQVWCQLAAVCHYAKDHSLVLCCTKNALQLEEAATKSLSTTHHVLYDQSAVNEMLSSAECLRALSLVHESTGHLQSYKEAMNMLLSSVRYAEKAENPTLCVAAARQYWNACLPLTQIPEERWQLQESLEKTVNALTVTHTKYTNKPSKVKGLLSLTTKSFGTSKPEASNEGDLTLRVAIYNLLLRIRIDKTDWKGALQLLDKAIRDMPCTTHRLSLVKHRILVKARLGQSVVMDMQKFEDEGEQCCSFMWHQVALCAASIHQQLTCYQKAITTLVSAEAQWQKVSLLLEFSEWMYCHNFPKADVQHQIQWAIDLLLRSDTEQTEGADDDTKTKDTNPRRCGSTVGVQGLLFTQSLFNVEDVRRLDSLIRAHTLLAVMAGRTSPEHRLNLLRAYTFVLQIWQVSMAVVCDISSEMAKSKPSQPPPSAGSKKGKDKGKGKKPSFDEDKPKLPVLDLTPPSTPKDWACFVCPDQARQIFRNNSNPNCLNIHSITKQTQSVFYLNLLAKELHSLSYTHLTLPIMHLAETVAHDLLDKRSLSDLYRLRIVRTCCQLGLETYSPYHEKLPSLSRIPEQEQMEYKAVVEELAGPRRHGLDMSTQDIWLDKADVCLSMGFFQPAQQLLAESYVVARELGNQITMARSLLGLASLACEEQNYGQALILLDEAQALGGDDEFWYQLTLTRVRAVVSQGDRDSTKIDQIIEQGCGALKQVLEQQVNRSPELTFMITSLQMRGAMESIRATDVVGPGGSLCSKAKQRLMVDCDKLQQFASSFTKLNNREQAAEAHTGSSQALRILAHHVTDVEEKQRFLLDALSQMQLAVAEQEHVVLNAQSLLPPQEECDGLSLAAVRRLLRLRLALAELCLTVLEDDCNERKCQALARQMKTSAEIAVEEFIRCTPEPDSIQQEWVSVVSTLGQVTLSQLAAVSTTYLENMEAEARCLGLMGKYFRLQAVLEDPIYLSSLWDPHMQETWSDPKVVSVQQEISEKDGESSRTELRTTSAKNAELQVHTCKAQQLLSQAGQALTEAINLCLQHGLPPSILADASHNMLECHGLSDPAVTGQYLALFQSCCALTMMAEVLSSACADTSASQFSALFSLRQTLLLSQEDRPSSMLKGAEDSLKILSKAFGHLSINPDHLNILAELPPNLKLLLLQHSQDGKELYGAMYEMTKAPENQKGKTTQATGTLTCSRVAKVPVCPQALLALRDQTQAIGQEARHGLLQEACWCGTEGRPEAPKHRQDYSHNCAADEILAPHFKELVQDMENYLNPLLTQFDFSCSRPQAASAPAPETTKTKDKDEKVSAVVLPAETGEYVVLLADPTLLELPLEALSVLQEERLTSVSRDFSLQLLHSRFHREEPEKVESDNKKETKGGRGTKAKGDQSQAIKVGTANCVLPPNTIPVNARNVKYIIDSYNEGNFGGTSLSKRMSEILESHSQHFTHLWEGVMGSKHRSSSSEMEQLLTRCSAFIYLGMEHFTRTIPPAKISALNLSECFMALLFDLVQNKTTDLRQSNLNLHKRSPENPLETSLLLSLGGVGCVVVNQWHSSLQQNTHNVASILDNLLKLKQTSGQTIHSLRKVHTHRSPIPNQKLVGSLDHVPHTDSDRDNLTPSAFNCVLYGLPNLIFT
ncbi:LOW QUALITY PROTEIN: cilia- and flagella-associated protein 46 [Sphaeramia orbicularis]|uniref:LOW QUALITY PROTEIN: cilia- and flagella-associated protein 46 n=1 Tax=Sphaeramia orbicularis TaxID=375764 RepID=UPI00117C577E|nr:LOW QUALITY PROTEIN: cilia- and flagella-associated protein 46 [Sphaeramia orbicularis]